MASPTSFPVTQATTADNPSQQQQSSVATPFPNPPSFWTSFTSSNISAYQALEAKASGFFAPLDFPPELRNLRPPTPPPNGEFHSFGEARSVFATLPPLPPHVSLNPDSQPNPQHLLNVTRSLLLSYLELLHVLHTDPSPSFYGPKWDDLHHLFQNAYHTLNAYRPWQAREALITILEETGEKARLEIKGVDELEVKVKGALDGLVETLMKEAEDGEKMEIDNKEKEIVVNGTGTGGTDGVNGVHPAGEEEELEKERRIWRVLDEELGS